MKIKKVDKSKLSDVDINSAPFGKVMSDHMVICNYKDGKWGEAEIVPFGPMSFSPAMSALHYGQSVFEGMTAYYNKDKNASVLFRISDHHKRLNKSLERLSMPTLPESLFIDSIKNLISIDHDWVPKNPSAYLYIRPFVFATDEYVGVKSSESYCFVVFTSPAAGYYQKKLKLKVDQEYSRAADGGVGFAKTAGNYAASLFATIKAQNEGFDQIVWTDPKDHLYVEESGTMNMFCVINNVLITPSIKDTILQGITRDSFIKICKDSGLKIEERQVSVSEIENAAKDKTLQGVFGTGTAATITEASSITINNQTYDLPQENNYIKNVVEELKSVKKGESSKYAEWITFVTNS